MTKRIVLLTGDDIAHRYVANTLCSALPILLIVVDHSKRKRKIARALRQGYLVLFLRALRTLLLFLIGDDRRRVRAVRSVFGEVGDSWAYPEKIVNVDGINSVDTVQAVLAVCPDLILVYGTSLVNDRVLGLAKEHRLNLHTGISPYYRGTACSFWPIVENNLDMIGATVHECTSRVDGGQIYSTVTVRYQRGDNLHTIFARTVYAGSQDLIKVVKTYLSGKLSGSPQDPGIGREYRGWELTLLPELRARLRLWRLARCRSV